MNIVETGMKIDLHIHSKASSTKDGAKVKNNTKENLPLLVAKLNDNEVNICAITDHDVFSYELYSELKKAEVEENTIKKVLPGVEFSVQFSLDNSISPIHIIAIFSDLDDEKVKKIAQILDINKPSTGGAYSEEEFLSILREIDIDTILIAHQKNSLSSQKPRKNDANSLGNAKFLEFVYTDYFEAFEFKNKRNEILNKAFLTTSNLEESLRFITGTDCHDWSCYPAEDLSDKMTDFPYTYAKCLPTFKGLVMAITDYSRLKTVNSFFNGSQQYVKKISLKVENTIFDVPLSQGINVIIGDNSIGKSLLLHALTNFEKPGAMRLPAKTKSGYMKYIKKNKLEIMSKIPIEEIFCFDMQGEVRAKFEENKLNASDFLREYFPPPVNSRVYRNAVENEIKRMIQYLKKKFDIESQINKLNAIIFQGMDKYEEMSSGLDAKIYFDLLSYEVTRSGVYIIDQPEDNISQSAIRNYLLSRFKTMGENRQIIMVTHNPQFIVNLDIDNLIFISKKDGKIKIQSGALEYACTEYNVLDIVAQNIDGGLETIQKRWKRYDKVASI